MHSQPPLSSQTAPQFPLPASLPPGPLTEQRLHTLLLNLREDLCNDLQFIAGIILNTGTLTEVPPKIQALTGLRIDQLEEMETRACVTSDEQHAPQDQTTIQLFENVRAIEWLVKVHLAALDEVLLARPQFRPISAEGAFRAFLELHDTIIGEMRSLVMPLSQGSASLTEVRRLATFWQEVLTPHARAEEQTLFPLAAALGDAALTRSAALVEAEHQPIDASIARYLHTVQQVEQGQAQLSQLASLALGLRGQVELHFGKEEQSIIRPLQQRITDEQFRPVVVAQEAAIGLWLHQRGWKWTPVAR